MAEPCEVLVIGGGLAGLCAAIAARRRGASVRLMESAPEALRGGNARHARNFRAAHDAPTPYSPGVYPAAEFLSELRRVSGPEGDEGLSRSLVGDTAALPSWLMGCGVHLQDPRIGLVPWSRRTTFLLGGGKAMLNALYQTAAKSGVAISYGRTAGSFVPAAGGGWSVRAAGEERPIAARAVIVAAGGAGGDPAWLRAHFGAEAERVAVRGGASSDGLALQRLIESGAKPVGDPAACHLVAVDARGPPFDGGIVTRITAIPHGIVVDRDGVPVEVAGAGARRTHYARWGPEIARAPGGIAFLILDADGLARAAPTAFAPIRAETIVGLARALGLDAAALERAVAAANATTHGPRVAAAPFFALPMRAGLTFVHYGVQVDTAMRVAMRNGQTAETLFAAGMAMAANVLRRGYLAGLGLTLAAVSGRRAGEAAADALR